MTPIENRVRVRRAGKLFCLVSAGQEVIAQGDRRTEHRLGSRKRPQLEPQVGVEADFCASGARAIDGSEHGVTGVGADCLANAGHMQHLGRPDYIQRQLGGAHSACRRAGA